MAVTPEAYSARSAEPGRLWWSRPGGSGVLGPVGKLAKPPHSKCGVCRFDSDLGYSPVHTSRLAARPSPHGRTRQILAAVGIWPWAYLGVAAAVVTGGRGDRHRGDDVEPHLPSVHWLSDTIAAALIGTGIAPILAAAIRPVRAAPVPPTG